MKLTSFRLKDRVHLLDPLKVGMIDDRWADRIPASLRDRLQDVFDSRDREA